METVQEAGPEGSFDLDDTSKASSNWWLDDDSISPALARNAVLSSAVDAIYASAVKDHPADVATGTSRACNLRRFCMSPPLTALRQAAGEPTFPLLAAAFFLAKPTESFASAWPRVMAYACDYQKQEYSSSELPTLLRGMSALLAVHHSKVKEFARVFLENGGKEVLEHLRQTSKEDKIRDEATRALAILLNQPNDKIVEKELEVEGWLAAKEEAGTRKKEKWVPPPPPPRMPKEQKTVEEAVEVPASRQEAAWLAAAAAEEVRKRTAASKEAASLAAAAAEEVRKRTAASKRTTAEEVQRKIAASRQPKMADEQWLDLDDNSPRFAAAVDSGLPTADTGAFSFLRPISVSSEGPEIVPVRPLSRLIPYGGENNQPVVPAAAKRREMAMPALEEEEEEPEEVQKPTSPVVKPLRPPPLPPPRDYERAAITQQQQRPTGIAELVKSSGLGTSVLDLLLSEKVDVADLVDALKADDLLDLLRDVGLKAAERAKLVRELKKQHSET